ncbi:hypothetical protein COCON_G00153360 [Conger conger]|uniref:Uncharacterized protein n=1 Tax=Conger conger TaxID=82655 RepID=A0A9Q1D9J4_CONCO|nr:hypothetical protein COCON_G00153360 [Conger conger]
MSEVQEAPENCQSEPELHPLPQEDMEVLQVLCPATLTDRTVGQKKLFSRIWRKAKPMWTVYIVLLLLFSTVSSNPIHARQCVLCLHPQCAKHIRRICKGDDFIWSNRMLGIENCSKDNLKPNEPCQLMNGNLVVQSDQPLSFEGNDSLSGGMKAFPSETVSCAGLDLPPGPKFTPAPLVNTTAHTTTPDTGPPSDHAAIWWSVGGVAIGVVIGIIVRKCWKRFKRCCRRRDGTGRNLCAS